MGKKPKIVEGGVHSALEISSFMMSGRDVLYINMFDTKRRIASVEWKGDERHYSDRHLEDNVSRCVITIHRTWIYRTIR